MQILKKYKKQIFSVFLLILSILAAFLHLRVLSLKKEEKFYDNQIRKLKSILSLMTKDINSISAYINNLKKVETLLKKYSFLFVSYNYALNVYNQIMALTLLTSNKGKIILSSPNVNDYEFSFFIEFNDPKILNDFFKNFLLNRKKIYAKLVDYKENKSTFYTKLKIYFLLQEKK